MKNLKFFSAFIVISLTVFYIGCGEDTTTNNNGGGSGTPPTINMQVGAVYEFAVDSLPTSGGVTGTRIETIQSYLAQGTFFGQSNVFQVRSVTQDSVITVPFAVDTFYVRYEGGKFYQYGVLQMISSTIPASWDLVADFTVTAGNTWSIGQNVPFQIGPVGGTANITGKIAVDTTFLTHGSSGQSVNAYRSEIVADLFITGGLNIGKVYVDYFIGDSDPASNPAGLVRLRLRPVNLSGFYTAAGVDQRIKAWTP
jgi:hypothetical protein